MPAPTVSSFSIVEIQDEQFLETDLEITPKGAENFLLILGSNFDLTAADFSVSLTPVAACPHVEFAAFTVYSRISGALLGSFVATGTNPPASVSLSVTVTNGSATAIHTETVKDGEPASTGPGGPVLGTTTGPNPTDFTLNQNSMSFSGELLENSNGVTNTISIDGTGFDSGATFSCMDNAGTIYSNYSVSPGQTATNIQGQFTATIPTPTPTPTPVGIIELPQTEAQTALTVTITNGDPDTGFTSQNVTIQVIPVLNPNPPIHPTLLPVPE